MKKYLFVIILSIISLISPLVLSASGIEDASKAMKGGEPEKAIEIYDSIAKRDGVSAELFTNLGNAWYENGNTGMAVLYLLRARMLNPADKQVNSNLGFLRSRVLDANKMELKDKKGNLEPQEPTFMESVYQYIALDHTSDMWATWAAILFIIAMGGAAAYFFTNSVMLRKVGFFAALIAIIVSVILIIFAFMAAHSEVNNKVAVVVVPKADLYTQPMAEAETSAAPIHSGSEVEILQRNNDGWVKVSYNSRSEGWTEAKNVMQVVEK